MIWEPIEKWDRKTNVDILAKTWVPETDGFKFSRFTNCVAVFSAKDEKRISGVPDNYKAVAFMPIPKIPKQWPEWET